MTAEVILPTADLCAALERVGNPRSGKESLAHVLEIRVSVRGM